MSAAISNTRDSIINRAENSSLSSIKDKVINKSRTNNSTSIAGGSTPNMTPNMTMPVALGYSANVIAIEKPADGCLGYQLSLNQKTRQAIAAEGLLVCPEIGDLVLCVEVNDCLFVSQVLRRKQSSASLIVQSSRPIEWVAPVLRFKALQEMELLSANKLTLSACDVVVGACQTLVQQARTFIQNAKNYSLTTKGLMRLNGRQQLIVAEEDLRMDAKRINMG